MSAGAIEACIIERSAVRASSTGSHVAGEVLHGKPYRGLLTLTSEYSGQVLSGAFDISPFWPPKVSSWNDKPHVGSANTAWRYRKNLWAHQCIRSITTEGHGSIFRSSWALWKHSSLSFKYSPIILYSLVYRTPWLFLLCDSPPQPWSLCLYTVGNKW